MLQSWDSICVRERERGESEKELCSTSFAVKELPQLILRLEVRIFTLVTNRCQFCSKLRNCHCMFFKSFFKQSL